MRTMSPRRRAAFGLWSALTFSSAVLVHGVVHAAGSPLFVWDSAAHVAMIAAALGLLAGVAAPLGLTGPARERRRRLSLVRAGLGPLTPRIVISGLAIQACVAGLLFAGEGSALQPERLAQALVCGLVALLCSAFLFRATRDRVVALLIALAAEPAPAAGCAAARYRSTPRPAASTVHYSLFVPNRPPPSLAA
ncbi:MAG: hypothetical protein JWO66_558 [Candidatus Eremiobacteraeota bacterium]|nr:hypothetical protein [Candidatus Eremiobacteraeota bacterium]